MLVGRFQNLSDSFIKLPLAFSSFLEAIARICSNRNCRKSHEMTNELSATFLILDIEVRRHDRHSAEIALFLFCRANRPRGKKT